MADVITKAFEEKQKSATESNPNNLDALRIKIIEEMQGLGFNDFNDYVNYLKEENKEAKICKNDAEME